ncbi:AMP-binding protein, partial [Lysinibacillus sp. D4A3_S15]|uniref:AMP-binding protein n=1 Tax=Lysinibacillus sp. D4A3_S15 TaxID=2941227 RepID=UPI0037CC883C
NTRVWTSTPSFAKMCLMNKEWEQRLMPALDTFLFCGVVLPIPVIKELMQRFPQATIYNLYGPTLTTVAVSYVKVT